MIALFGNFKGVLERIPGRTRMLQVLSLLNPSTFPIENVKLRVKDSDFKLFLLGLYRD